MSQASLTIGANQSGLAYRTADNDRAAAIASCHKGTTAPSYAVAGMQWIDDSSSVWVLKIYDGADWISLARIDPVNNLYTPVAPMRSTVTSLSPRRVSAFRADAKNDTSDPTNTFGGGIALTDQGGTTNGYAMIYAYGDQLRLQSHNGSLGSTDPFAAQAATTQFILKQDGCVGVGVNPISKMHVYNATSGMNGLRAEAVIGNSETLFVYANHASFASVLGHFWCNTAGGNGWSFLRCASTGGSDLEFMVRGDGAVFSDGGTSMSTPADYADAMEWADGNPGHEDRVGLSVVLDGGDGKIRPALATDAPDDVIGIVSGNPSVCGRAAWNRWQGQYLSDEFNRPILEDYQMVEWVETIPPVLADMRVPDPQNPANLVTVSVVTEPARNVNHSYDVNAVPAGVVVPADAVTKTLQRRKQNPSYNPATAYEPRLGRPEWSAIGLCGIVPLRKGQPVHPHWRKMRDINADVEEWLVR
jgi:hypothetical protein